MAISELRARVRSAVVAVVLVATLGAASLLVIVLALLRAPRRWLDAIYVAFARVALWVAGTRVEVRGVEHVRPGTGYVIVPNHESAWDPVVLFAALSCLAVRTVAKEQMIRMPLLGRALLLSGNIRVARADTAADVDRIREAMAGRERDVSIVFYAEGTRSRDGALHAFKKGAFATAIAYGLPVLPVGTAGTGPIWPPGTLRIRPGLVTVEVGEPIPVDGLSLEQRDALRVRTHDAVRELRRRARGRLVERGGDPGGVDGGRIVPLHSPAGHRRSA